MGSELIFRGHESQPLSETAYSPKPPKPWLAVTRPVRYLLREQRLLFVFLGIAIASLFFTLLPPLLSPPPLPTPCIPPMAPPFPSAIRSAILSSRPSQLAWRIDSRSNSRISTGRCRWG
ncbi:hypothetical protein Dimus_035923 [Dionaea muscipula]